MKARLLTKTILGDNLSQSQTAAFCHRRRSVKLLLLNLETAKAKAKGIIFFGTIFFNNDKQITTAFVCGVICTESFANNNVVKSESCCSPAHSLSMCDQKRPPRPSVSVQQCRRDRTNNQRNRSNLGRIITDPYCPHYQHQLVTLSFSPGCHQQQQI